MRDERPTYKLNEQEKFWTAGKFMVLLVATLVVAIGIIVSAANMSYERNGNWFGFTV